MKPDLNEAKPFFPWNKGRLVGQKAPLKLKEIWAIRIRLQLSEKVRDLALFNLAIDSKLRGCDLVSLRVCDISQGKSIYPRAIVMQRKTHRPVQFEITELTRQSVAAWIDLARLAPDNYLFPSRITKSPHLSTRQYARIVAGWVKSIGLDPATWHAHYASNQGDAHLPANEEPSGRPTPSWTYQVGKHGAIPWHRSRRCAGNGRADRNVKFAYNRTAHLSELSLSGQERK